MKEPIFVTHPFPPCYNSESTILILGSFPSIKSREENFYYAHPQNRFWRVCSAIFKKETPQTIEEKKHFLLENGIGLYDTIYSCTISGSADSSIRDITPSDIGDILKNSKIERIFCNGRTSHKYYNRYIKKSVHKDATYLPSSSSANASFSLERLIDEWSIILPAEDR